MMYIQNMIKIFKLMCKISTKNYQNPIYANVFDLLPTVLNSTALCTADQGYEKLSNQEKMKIFFIREISHGFTYFPNTFVVEWQNILKINLIVHMYLHNIQFLLY